MTNQNKNAVCDWCDSLAIGTDAVSDRDVVVLASPGCRRFPRLGLRNRRDEAAVPWETFAPSLTCVV